jgi:hypothetical protein
VLKKILAFVGKFILAAVKERFEEEARKRLPESK